MTNINSLLQQIAHDDQRIAEESRFIAADTERRWREGAGPLYDVLVSSRAKAVEALCDPDESVRKVAMSMFKDHWPPDPEVEEICRRNTFAGSRSLRTSAIITLAFIRNRLYKEKVAITLADYVLNTALEWDIRRSSYAMLVISFGTQAEKEAVFRATPESKVEGVSKIDAELVQRCVAADYTSDGPVKP